MDQIDSAGFEALWATAQSQPAVRTIAPQPFTVDLSLSGILDQYLAIAAKSLAGGTITQADYDELSTNVAAVKPVLVRINDGVRLTGVTLKLPPVAPPSKLS